MKKMKRVLSLAMAVAIGCVCVAQADTVEDAKARRKERREQVDQLIQAGKAEEGSDGYLVAKSGADVEGAKLIQAENADRKIGYAVIAKANGETVEDAGKQAAAIIKAHASKEK